MKNKDEEKPVKKKPEKSAKADKKKPEKSAKGKTGHTWPDFLAKGKK